MTRQSGDASLRALPSVDRVLQDPAITRLLVAWERPAVTEVIRRTVARARDRVIRGEPAPTMAAIVAGVEREVSDWARPACQVINATGVVLHTNLGRAPLSERAIQAVVTAAGYTDLEIDLASGRRGFRQARAVSLLTALTGASAAHVATSNAAAVLLVLAALARRRQVIVSRGQAVEIGGGFRVPAIMRQSGATLIEVGTTNRTRVADYEEAISPRTAAILHVHRSNFKIVGFAAEPRLEEIAALAHRHGILLLADNGSGALVDTAAYGLPHEPMPVDALRAGADVVMFSGDKLLGGPQSGLIVGEEEALRRISAHSLARALRPDKLQLAALSATLRAYLDGTAAATTPVLQMLAQTGEQIAERAAAFRERARQRGVQFDLLSDRSPVGGGSLPTETLPTTLLVAPRSLSASDLRAAAPPVVARNQDGRVMLDLRTVAPRDEEALLQGILSVIDSVAR